MQRHQLDQLTEQLATRAGADARARAAPARRGCAACRSRTRTAALSDALERARLLDEQGVDDRRFARRVEELLRHDRPIIVGPWTGRGRVRAALLGAVRALGHDDVRHPPERLLVVSRGGVAAWYGGLAARYADVFSFFSPAEFRAATEDAKKQRRVGAFDAEVVKRVVAAHRLERADLLHPGMMYRLFMPFWKDVATIARVETRITTYDAARSRPTIRFCGSCRPTTWRRGSISATAFPTRRRTGRSSRPRSTPSAGTCPWCC